MLCEDRDITFQVVTNQAGQYSLWPEHRPVPGGWWVTGFGGDRNQCLRHIEQVWTDPRPLALRQALDMAEG